MPSYQGIFVHLHVGAGATVHDMFNWMSVIILLPLELIIDAITGTGGYLYHLSYQVVQAFNLPTEEGEEVEFLDVITDPLTEKIVKVRICSPKIQATRHFLLDECAQHKNACFS